MFESLLKFFTQPKTLSQVIFLCPTRKSIENFFCDVHFRISLCETLKISDFNLICRLKILPFATLIEPYGYARNSQKIKKSYFCPSHHIYKIKSKFYNQRVVLAEK